MTSHDDGGNVCMADHQLLHIPTGVEVIIRLNSCD
jgi:hypothetical protein